MPKRKQKSSSSSSSSSNTAPPTTASTTASAPLPLAPQIIERIIQLQGHDVKLTWEEKIDAKAIDAILQSVPFRNWQEGINNITNPDPSRPNLNVESIHVQGVDMFGPRVGFSKFKVTAKKWNEKDSKIETIPGIVFMRGGAVGILCILKDTLEGKEYALTTLQPRIPAASAEFCEIPAGMLDEVKHKFAGKAAEEMNEETLLQINEEDLIDLTDMAYKGKYHGMYPSAGGCDEFIRLFLYRRYMSTEVIEALKDAQGGVESEIIKLKLVPIKDLWLVSPDAKALSALYLYDRYRELFPDVQPLPADQEREALLLDKILAQKNKGKEKVESGSEGEDTLPTKKTKL